MNQHLDTNAWNNAVLCASQHAMMATYEIDGLSKERGIVDNAAFKADSLFRAAFIDKPSIETFIENESTWLNDEQLPLETRHALKRMFLEARNQLKTSNIDVPDNFAAYINLSQTPGIIEKAGLGK